MAPDPAGTGDMFLMVKGSNAGLIKGESVDESHKDEIDVLSWSWGMQAKHSLGGGNAATGRPSIHDLKIIKRVDSASTGLMNALRSNEPIKAVLTLRKAGKTQLEFLKITIDQGRVISLTIGGGDEQGGHGVVEHIAFAFNQITVEYTPQGKDGQGRGGMVFQDQYVTA